MHPARLLARQDGLHSRLAGVAWPAARHSGGGGGSSGAAAAAAAAPPRRDVRAHARRAGAAKKVPVVEKLEWSEPLAVLRYPDPRLRAPNARIGVFDDSLARLAAAMFKVMYEDDGVGLAAPQVGVNVRLMVFNETATPGSAAETVLVNPTLVEAGRGTALDVEGCLSFPGIYADVERSLKIEVQYQDLQGRLCQLALRDFEARVFQHEYDHLQGVLYHDRMRAAELEKVRPALVALEEEFLAAHPGADVVRVPPPARPGAAKAKGFGGPARRPRFGARPAAAAGAVDPAPHDRAPTFATARAAPAQRQQPRCAAAMAVSTLARTRAFAGACSTARPAQPARAVRMVVRASAQKQQQLSALVKPAVATAVANVIMALPAAAEAGKLFDFNLTLPIMASEILILMVFLDKFWFGPVGKVLDERDTLLRSQLGSVKDGSSELSKLTMEAEALLKDARSEVSAMVNSKKGAKQAELDKMYAEAKAKVTKETEAAIAVMEKESEGLLKSLDAQAEKISDQAIFLQHVCPALGCVVAFIMFASPLPAVREVDANRSIGELNALPFIAMAVNCAGWLFYGTVLRDFYVYAGNIPGVLFGLYYTLTCFKWSSEPAQNTLRALSLGAVALLYVVGLAGMAAGLGRAGIKTLWGSACVAILGVYYTAPLSSLAKVIATRDSSSLHWPLCAMNIINGMLWFAYGLALRDWFIGIPNGAGAAFNAVALAFCFAFPAKGRSRAAPGPGGAQLGANWGALRLQSMRDPRTGAAALPAGGFFDLAQLRWRAGDAARSFVRLASGRAPSAAALPRPPDAAGAAGAAAPGDASARTSQDTADLQVHHLEVVCGADADAKAAAGSGGGGSSGSDSARRGGGGADANGGA
ncbi:hypothetical protein HT031_001874 [Scenedesmus sp. PABB004]|nr:hypothetical protein HT031_001874 [Scenedesmus sp. PABB004]